MKPTPEQIAAAKAVGNGTDTAIHREAIREFMIGRNVDFHDGMFLILLAALEAAEERIEELGYELQDAHNRSVE